MSELIHNGRVIQTSRDNWQTKARGSNEQEYLIYRACCDNGQGLDITTNKPLKTYEQWINS